MEWSNVSFSFLCDVQLASLKPYLIARLIYRCRANWLRSIQTRSFRYFWNAQEGFSNPKMGIFRKQTPKYRCTKSSNPYAGQARRIPIEHSTKREYRLQIVSSRRRMTRESNGQSTLQSAKDTKTTLASLGYSICRLKDYDVFAAKYRWMENCKAKKSQDQASSRQKRTDHSYPHYFHQWLWCPRLMNKEFKIVLPQKKTAMQ